MKNKLRYIIFLLLSAYCLLLLVFAQTPTVEKIEPPNWWANYSINPVRVLVRGKNLTVANVVAPLNSGLKAYNFRTSDNGNYLFFDVEIAPNATLTDRLNKISDVKINNGKVNFSMPARTAGVFTIKK